MGENRRITQNEEIMKADFCKEMRERCCSGQSVLEKNKNWDERSKEWQSCCSGEEGFDPGKFGEKKEKGMSSFCNVGKGFLIIPGIIILAALLLGYFLDAEVVRILWMVLFGTFALMGFVGYFFMNRMFKRF